MSEVIGKNEPSEAQPAEKNWSWIMFFLIGGLFNQKMLDAGLVGMFAYLILIFLVPSIFYRITRKIKWPKSRYIKNVLVGFVLLVIATFVLGAAGAIDIMLT